MPSTVIRTFHYEPDHCRLTIEFLSGRRYAYFDVPPDVYEDMRRSRSRGTFFNKEIRDRFAYANVDAPM
jgi:hypothetical protein